MPVVTILGTGWMGRALGARISRCPQYHVVFGARDPEAAATSGFELGGTVLSLKEAIQASDGLVVMAVPAAAHSSVAVAYGQALAGKVVIDISNTSQGPRTEKTPPHTTTAAYKAHHSTTTVPVDLAPSSPAQSAHEAHSTAAQSSTPATAIDIPSSTDSGLTSKSSALTGQGAVRSLGAHGLDGVFCAQYDKHSGQGQGAYRSVAEHLAGLLPRCQVVKAFNTLSAFELTGQVSKGIPPRVDIAADDNAAAASVAQLVQDMGMTAVRLPGGLQAARELEGSQMRLFPAWRAPLSITAVVFAFFFIYSILWYLVLPAGIMEMGRKTIAPWDQLPLTVMNTAIANTGAALLALVFSAGVAASLAQLLRWDARRAFPAWLAGWMNCRKQLGLLAAWLILVHAIMMCLSLAPIPYFSLYDYMRTAPGQPPLPTTLNWLGQLSLLLGVLGFSLLVVMSISSLPAVGGQLSFAEWRFTFSWVGVTVLLLSFGHVLLYVLSFIYCSICKIGDRTSIDYAWPKNSTGGPIPPPAWITVGVLGLPLAARLVLALPPFNGWLDGLRQGRLRSGTKARDHIAPHTSHDV